MDMAADMSCTHEIVQHSMNSRRDSVASNSLNRSPHSLFEDEDLEERFDLRTPRHFWSDSDEVGGWRFRNSPLPVLRVSISQQINEAHNEQTSRAANDGPYSESLPRSPHEIEVPRLGPALPIHQLEAPQPTIPFARSSPQHLSSNSEEASWSSIRFDSDYSMNRPHRSIASRPNSGRQFSDNGRDRSRGQPQLAQLTGYSDSDIDEESDADEAHNRDHSFASQKQGFSRPDSSTQLWQSMGVVEACVVLGLDGGIGEVDLGILDELVMLLVNANPELEAKFREAQAVILQDQGYKIDGASTTRKQQNTTTMKTNNSRARLETNHREVQQSSSRKPSTSGRNVGSLNPSVESANSSKPDTTRQALDNRSSLRTAPTEARPVDRRKRPLTPSAPLNTAKPKRQKRRGPFLDSSGSEDDELPSPVQAPAPAPAPAPEKLPGRQFNFGRLKQMMAKNGSQANVRKAIDIEDQPANRERASVRSTLLSEHTRLVIGDRSSCTGEAAMREGSASAIAKSNEDRPKVSSRTAMLPQSLRATPQPGFRERTPITQAMLSKEGAHPQTPALVNGSQTQQLANERINAVLNTQRSQPKKLPSHVQPTLPEKRKAEESPLMSNATTTPAKKAGISSQASITGQQRTPKGPRDNDVSSTAKKPYAAAPTAKATINKTVAQQITNPIATTHRKTLKPPKPASSALRDILTEASATADKVNSPSRAVPGSKRQPDNRSANRAVPTPSRTVRKEDDVNPPTVDNTKVGRDRSPSSSAAQIGERTKTITPKVPTASKKALEHANILSAGQSSASGKTPPKAAARVSAKQTELSSSAERRALSKDQSAQSEAQKPLGKAKSVRDKADAIEQGHGAIRISEAAPPVVSAQHDRASDISKPITVKRHQNYRPDQAKVHATAVPVKKAESMAESAVTPQKTAEEHNVKSASPKQSKCLPATKPVPIEQDEPVLKHREVAKAVQPEKPLATLEPSPAGPKATRVKVTDGIPENRFIAPAPEPVPKPAEKTVDSPVVILPTPPPLRSGEDGEPYFEYSIFRKLWSDSNNEADVKPTELTDRMLTSVEEANRRAEKLFASETRQFANSLPVQFQGSSMTRNENDCISFVGTLAPINFTSRKSYVKIWVERHFVSAHAAAIQAPPQHTPFISKTLYILRLHKFIENPNTPSDLSDSDTEAATSSDSSSDSNADSDSDPDKGKHKKKENLKLKTKDNLKDPKPRNPERDDRQHFIRQHHPLPCAEVYTTLSGANRAARRVQIAMSHDDNPSSQGAAKWQEQNARELLERVHALELAVEGDGGERYWKSEFNESKLGGDRFELLVEKVGLCGPRNL